MPSNKWKKRQLQRRRRIEKDAATASKDDTIWSSEKMSMQGPNRTRKIKSIYTGRTLDARTRSSKGAENRPVDSFFSWVREKNASTIFSPTSYFISSPTTAIYVLVLSFVLRNRDYLLQATGVTTPSSAVAKIILYVAIAALMLIPFLLWWLIRDEIWSEDTSAQNGKISDEPNGIDDEFITILPLGLKQSSAITNESALDSYEVIPTPQLALSKHVRRKLAEWLPFGLRHTSNLKLVFSTDVHGRSLQTLYHILETTSSCHTIMLLEIYPTESPIVKELQTKTIIGIYASQRWHSSSKLYGDGRCFLFRLLLPDRQESDNNGDEEVLDSDCWQWTPLAISSEHLSTSLNLRSNHNVDNENGRLSLWETFQRSNHSCLSLGISDSGVGTGLQLNHDMTKGESHRAVGFNNEPLCFRSNAATENSVHFEVGLVEVYQLVREIDGLPIR